MSNVAVGPEPTRTSGRRTGELRYALVRLVPSAVLVWAIICGLGYLLTRPLRVTSFELWDESVSRFVANHRSTEWNTVTHWVTFTAETYTVIAVGLVFFVAMRMRLRRWRESLFLLHALLGEVKIFVCSTMIIARPRPAVPHRDDAPPPSSLPSGNTAAAVTV